MELWEKIDRDRIESFGYGLLPEDTGPVGQRIRRALEHFTDLSAGSAASMAQKIRDDEIQILFDLNGYTQNARPDLFALRPAPVQINSMGFPGTLGAGWYDYIHVDAFVAPHENSGLPFQPLILVSGLIVTTIGIGGWLIESMREWRRTAATEQVLGETAVAVQPVLAPPRSHSVN